MKKIKTLLLGITTLLLLAPLSSCHYSVAKDIFKPFTEGFTIDGKTYSFTGEVLVEGSTVEGKSEYNPVKHWNGGKGYYSEYKDNSNMEKYAGFFEEGRNIILSSFIMSKYEVTQELYEAVMGSNPSECVTTDTTYDEMAEGEKPELRPVDSVTWYDAAIFCNKLTKLVFGEDTDEVVYYADKEFTVEYTADTDTPDNCYLYNEKKGFRLPTACEWEYAARGGKVGLANGTFKEFYAGADLTEDSLDSEKSQDSSQTVNTDIDEIGWYSANLLTGTSNASTIAPGATAGEQDRLAERNQTNLDSTT